MERKDELSNNFDETPNADDERFWRDFGNELWLMLKQDAAKTAEQKTTATVGQTDFGTANCLSFARLNELARSSAAAHAEENHLARCRYCERRLHKFRELAPPIKNDGAIAENPDAPPFLPEPKRTFWTKTKDFFRFDKLTAARPAMALASVICGLLLTGAIFFMILRLSPITEQMAVGVPNPIAEENPSKDVFRSGEDSYSDNSSNSNQISANQTFPNRTSPSNLTSHPDSAKTAERNTDSSDELEGVPPSEREAVVAALRSAPVPISEDLRLFRAAPVLRNEDAAQNRTKTPRPLSPVNRAVGETSPVLRWQTIENVEYFVVITDRARREVAKSGALQQNSWRVSKQLPSGLYFWTVTAKTADGAEIVSDARPALFKVVAGAEKESLEKTKRQVKSGFARAVIYFRAGLFDEAERELSVELKQKPNSRRAQKLLRRIREFEDTAVKP